MRGVWALLLCMLPLWAQAVELPGIQIDIQAAQGPQQISQVVKVLVVLTLLSLAPSILIVMTSFTRIIIVLALMRQALGLQQTPPNTVLISLALFLTLFTMTPVIQEMNQQAYQPLMAEQIDSDTALARASLAIKHFMLKQTREEDLLLMVELSGLDQAPTTVEDVSLVMLVPAFMLSELLMAFQIGFVIFIPFLLVDLIVASILMSMGMLMVPPMMISLPIKILLFVLIDGWNLIIKSLMQSFV